MCAIESGFVYHANNSENRWNLEFISSDSRAYKYYLKAFIDFVLSHFQDLRIFPFLWKDVKYCNSKGIGRRQNPVKVNNKQREQKYYVYTSYRDQTLFTEQFFPWI